MGRMIWTILAARPTGRRGVEDALARTVATAGRTVAFSGLTVAISLAGLRFSRMWPAAYCSRGTSAKRLPSGSSNSDHQPNGCRTGGWGN